jgi:parallel beta-helix repeat protein
MTAFTIDLLNGSNEPIGDGPLTNVLSVSIQEKLDESGAISFVVPATDLRVATLLDQAARFRVRLSSGALVYGIIDKDALDATADQPNRTVQGADMLRELQHYSMGWWCFFDDQDLNTIVLPKLVQDTGWTLGTVDAALGTIYYSFDGDSRLAALIKIATNTGKHFRLGSAFRSIDFGAFGASSGVTFANVETALVSNDGIPIISALQLTSDRAPVVNRIIPWGAGQDGGDTHRAKVSLFHLTPGDSRWSEIKVKPGVRGATATIMAVGAIDGKDAQYITSDTTGFSDTPITQVFWCYDPDDLTLGCGYDMVIRSVHTNTDIVVRGSPTIPSAPGHFPAYLISNPQLYIEDAAAYAADPHEAVVIFSDVTLTDLSLGAFESAASQLYNRAKQYLDNHKTPQISYAVSTFNCPDTLHVGDLVHVTYSGDVTRNGVTVSWVDVDTDLFVVNITRTFNADGSTNAVVEVSDIPQQAIDSAGAIANSAGTVGYHAVTVGAPSVSSSGAGSGGSGSAGDPLTFAPPLVRTIDRVTLPLTDGHLFVGDATDVPADVALSGDATLANTGELTLDTVNSNVGSFRKANITVNAKGLVTAAAESTDRIFNVLDYGAAGDGATDDSAAIAACITAALSVPGAIYFPAGRYLVENVNIPDGIHQVFGPGVIVDSSGSAGYDAVVTLGGESCISGSGGEVVEFLDWSVSIEVGEITTLRALACGALKNSRIHNMLISWGPTRTEECYGIDLRWLDGLDVTNNVVIADNVIVAPFFADYAGRFSAIALIGNSTAFGGYYSSGDGSTVEPTMPVTRVVVANNVINGGSHGITLNGCVNCTVSGNTLHETKHRGIVCEPACTKNTISGNTIREYGSSGILLAYGCKYNVISGNQLHTEDDTGEGGIQLYLGCERNLVTGNSVHGSTNYGIYVAVGALYNTLSGNRISGYKLAGVALENDWNNPLPSGADYSRPNFGAPPSPYTNYAYSHTQGNSIINNFIGDPRSTPDNACAIYLAQLNGYNGTTKTYNYLNEISGNVVQPYLTLAYDLFVFEEQTYYCSLNTFRNNTLYALTASKISWTRYRNHFRVCDGNEALNIPTDVPGGPGLPSIAFAAGDTSPDVSFGDSFYCDNNTNTTITAFDNGYFSQEFTLQLDAHTGLTHNAGAIALQGDASIAAGACTAGNLMRFKYINGVWYEMWRNFNGSAGGGIPPGYFGDGSDGDVTISADTMLSLIAHYNNLTVDTGYILTVESRLPIYVKDTLTINGTIRSPHYNSGSGGNNSGATGGAGGDGEPYGKNGGNANANGGDGDPPQTGFDQVLSSSPETGANGGNGAVGSGGIGSGGIDSDVYYPGNYASATTGQRHVNQVTVSSDLTISNAVPGGSGSGGGGATKGGGGAGGTGESRQGYLSIIARNIVWGAAGAIECLGGDGGNGGNSDGDGGGGGGGAGGNGGIVILCYATETGTRNVDVSGGTGGTGGTSVSASAGANGPDGYDGVVIDLGV